MPRIFQLLQICDIVFVNQVKFSSIDLRKIYNILHIHCDALDFVSMEVLLNDCRVFYEYWVQKCSTFAELDAINIWNHIIISECFTF